jgi:hypothetical protein
LKLKYLSILLTTSPGYSTTCGKDYQKQKEFKTQNISSATSESTLEKMDVHGSMILANSHLRY